MQPVTLTDGVVTLSPPAEDDAEAITQACQDPGIAAWVPIPQPYGHEHARGFLRDVVDPGWAEGGTLTWAIRDAQGGVLGMVDLHGLAGASAELGFWTAPWARDRGVMTRAVLLVLGYAFGADGPALQRVVWRAAVGNWASRRVAWRTGFRVEGTVRGDLLFRDGVRRDAWVGTILRDDAREPAEPWPATTAAPAGRAPAHAPVGPTG